MHRTRAPAPAGPRLSNPNLQGDLAAFAHYLVAERGLARNTVLAYTSDLDRFARWADGKLADASAASLDELEAYVAYLLGLGLAPSSVGRAIASLRAFYRFLALDRGTDNCAADLLDAPSCWKKLPRALSNVQVHRLLDAPDPARDKWGLRDRALLEVLYATGCRASEVCDLQLADVDLADGSARVRGKGGKDRLVLLGKPAVAALIAYLDGQRPQLVRRPGDASFVFLSQKGPLQRVMLFLIVKKYARRARIPAAAAFTHALRHSCASDLLGGGADLRVIQELLGHSKITTTEKYLAITDGQLVAAHREHHPRGK
jgi:integrase/recombinase XerD